MVENPVKAARKCLSADCWQAIFSYLGDEDMKAVSLTCKDFLAYSSALKKSLKVVHPQISMLSRHLNRFTHLKTIDLLRFEGDVTKAIRVIACSAIQLEAVYTSFPNQVCTFRGEFDCTQLALLVDKNPNLEQLRIERHSFSPILSGSGLDLLASKLRLLKKIHLPSCCVSDQFIVALSLNCVFLKEVTILSHGDQSVTENAVAQLLQNRPNLEALSIECMVEYDSSSVSQSSLITIEHSISHAKALSSLVLGGISNTDKVLMAIAKAKLRLNNLGLIACGNLTVSGLLLVLSNHLTKLRIERASFTDEDMKLLLKGDVGKLTHIEINGCHVAKSTLFLLLARCPSLVDIRMISTGLGGRVQNVSLSRHHKLQCLCLDNCHGIDGKLLKNLGGLSNLKVLDLSYCYGVTTKHIQAILKSCKHVTTLNLAGFLGAKVIEGDDSQFPELNLENLKLSYSNIGDEGLAVIAKKCPRLLSLDLYDCERITTEGMKQVVKHIKTLTSLNLMYSGDNHFGALLEWMLSTGNLASLKRIFLQDFTKEVRDLFLQHGCLLLTRCLQ